ncbi:uncharacterized protein TRAVEDRAFT_52179 [Trametes versicolor FP-101664 SS1]|uniref:uncharacterized protein n=1 Tax=Trametes versicolor (strain FP-101664) TaxID=717944 RepID=UPI00046213EE|nr:uncharacterized protein TRAVEDRAFT_52179 [Trametes versicolor FP-101664 SS1]EIW54474.1 hypothetical protein TRAVEDRAFT_52179 [Trametes versicolor FP-101664 SS1]
MLEESVEVCFDDMLDLFLPGEDPGNASFAKLFNDIPQVEGKEANLYGALVDVINKSDILQGYILTLHSASGDTELTIDGGMYATNECTTTRNKSADWSTLELSFLCKVDDNANDEQPPSNERIPCLEQILSHGTLVFDRQHRTHHYTIVTFGTLARVVRLDRAGAIFSEKFDYTDEPAKLARFLWRFSRLSATQRGHDPTATQVFPGSPDHDFMIACASTPRPGIGDYARVLFQESLAHEWPWWRITVEDAGGPRDFLVGRPTFVACGLVGRGTRGYIALDLCNPDHPIVFLKDCWRVLHERSETEGAILSYLNECDVEGIPSRLCDGDVGEQETVSQDVWKAKHVGEECRMKHHRHYRLAVKEVGIPLYKFETGRQLVFMFIDCLEAHKSAYLKAGVIHRDISSGNFLMLPTKLPGADGKAVYRGLLTDWELSKRIEYDGEAPRLSGRAGTWQFMSVNALNNPDKEISIPDELESFFHALLWFAIRWLPHNCNDVDKFMFEYFDTGRTENGKEYTCGTVKQSTMNSAHLITPTNASLHFFRRPLSKKGPQGPSAQLLTSGDPSDSSEPSTSAVKAPEWSEADLHPIDDVFAELLDWFQAAYRLANHRKLRSTPVPTQQPLEGLDAARFKRFQLLLAEDSQPLGVALSDPTLQQTRAGLEERAKKLETHKAMLKFLYARAFAPDVWPQGDRQPDQLSRKFNPKN